MIDNKEITKSLLEDVPNFSQAYNELLDENGGEMGIYITFSGLARFFIEAYQKSSGDFDVIQGFILKLLEKNDKEIDELVSIGFLEDLHLAGDDYDEMKEQMDPRLRDLLVEIEKFWQSGKQ